MTNDRVALLTDAKAQLEELNNIVKSRKKYLHYEIEDIINVSLEKEKSKTKSLLEQGVFRVESWQKLISEDVIRIEDETTMELNERIKALIDVAIIIKIVVNDKCSISFPADSPVALLKKNGRLKGPKPEIPTDVHIIENFERYIVPSTKVAPRVAEDIGTVTSGIYESVEESKKTTAKISHLLGRFTGDVIGSAISPSVIALKGVSDAVKAVADATPVVVGANMYNKAKKQEKHNSKFDENTLIGELYGPIEVYKSAYINVCFNYGRDILDKLIEVIEVGLKKIGYEISAHEYHNQCVLNQIEECDTQLNLVVNNSIKDLIERSIIKISDEKHGGWLGYAGFASLGLAAFFLSGVGTVIGVTAILGSVGSRISGRRKHSKKVEEINGNRLNSSKSDKCKKILEEVKENQTNYIVKYGKNDAPYDANSRKAVLEMIDVFNEQAAVFTNKSNLSLEDALRLAWITGSVVGFEKLMKVTSYGN
ncbi:hypothetical protein EQG49_03745 [Periweissella cryptocerci]|uniref:Uncharacterized protein n=1 Tax=Periweissella cryptocerci TaxID=2506420 RepID=A0A4P6YSL9_9LACO|nr:hypothetical protein [Periweissella cryptocerci]QBO35632.1 hypothetical protein EQG49_03745 [Periweissella cryptocerci]